MSFQKIKGQKKFMTIQADTAKAFDKIQPLP